MGAVFDRRKPDPEQGVFETLLVVEGRPVELGAHLARLTASLTDLFPGRPVPLLSGAIRTRAQGVEHGAIRVVVAPGADANLGAEVQLRSPRGDFLAASDRKSPRQKAALHSLEIAGGLGPHKWADRSLLEPQAGLSADALPLIVDRDGGVLEASRANIFAVRNGALLTPPTDGRILPGITRARLIEIASETGMEVDETGLSREDLLAADEVFLTGSIRGIEQVSSLDGTRLGGCGEVAAGLAATLLETWTAAKVG
jgi:para-aminobenzoate synthetase / 4-amino-4-deoxychorismate lyase